MTRRFAFVSLFLLLSTTSAALAAPASEPAAVPVLAISATPIAPPAPRVLDRQAIYEILCGGSALPDPRLQEHLWKVAGSLASKSWTPPKVTVRVVTGVTPR